MTQNLQSALVIVEAIAGRLSTMVVVGISATVQAKNRNRKYGSRQRVAGGGSGSRVRAHTASMGMALRRERRAAERREEEIALVGERKRGGATLVDQMLDYIETKLEVSYLSTFGVGHTFPRHDVTLPPVPKPRTALALSGV